MKRSLITLVILIGLLVILYELLSYAHFKPLFPPLPVGKSAFTIETMQIKETTDAYTIDVQYPQFGNTTIDTQIKKAVVDAIAQFKKIPPSPVGSSLPKNQLTGTYDKLYVGLDYISFELVMSQYTGGAHGMTAYTGLNFDRTTGKELTLDDALSLTGLSLDQLAVRSKTQLEKSLGSGLQFPDGVSADQKNFGSFTISSDAVTFVFQEYQVAAYAAGAQEASFPRVR